VVPDGRGISLKDEEVRQTEDGGVQKLRLEGQSVSITAGQVKDRLHASRLQEDTNGKRSHPHDGTLKVWDTDRVDAALEGLGTLKKFRKVIALGGLELSDNDKSPRFQPLLQ